jgi:hypothetical protein
VLEELLRTTRPKFASLDDFLAASVFFCTRADGQTGARMTEPYQQHHRVEFARQIADVFRTKDISKILPRVWACTLKNARHTDYFSFSADEHRYFLDQQDLLGVNGTRKKAMELLVPETARRNEMLNLVLARRLSEGFEDVAQVENAETQ